MTVDYKTPARALSIPVMYESVVICQMSGIMYLADFFLFCLASVGNSRAFQVYILNFHYILLTF